MWQPWVEGHGGVGHPGWKGTVEVTTLGGRERRGDGNPGWKATAEVATLDGRALLR